MSNQISESYSEGCSIAIKCADDLRIKRCLDSIDDPTVSVNVVITPSRRIESLLSERNIPFVVTEYGNIAKSAQISVDEAEYNNVIVMDSDAYFAAGAISRLRKALQSTIIAKPSLVFHNNGSMISKTIAENRQRYHALPNHATNPGLALKRSELEDRCGYIFNPLIRWTEDTDLNYRMKHNNVSITTVADAVVFHDPVTLSHELKSAFLYGIGKRLSIEHTPGREPVEELGMIAEELFLNCNPDRIKEKIEQRGIEGLVLTSIWRAIYLSGYHSQKQFGRWSIT